MNLIAEPVKHVLYNKMPPVASWLVAVLSAFWMSLPVAVQSLLYLMILDYISGLLASAKEGKLSSSKAYKGISGKLLIVIMVSAAHIISHIPHLAFLPFDLGVVIASAYCVNELVSITENCSRGGVRVPNKLIKLLDNFRESSKWAGPERRGAKSSSKAPKKV